MLNIAQRFNAGFEGQRDQVPAGTKELEFVIKHSFVPEGTGPFYDVIPALKRWAMFSQTPSGRRRHHKIDNRGLPPQLVSGIRNM